ncbi:MAG: IPT/TIG domain-containing protein [Acidobacteria bacterium]|nr:IPT/TIG domain-containing protein [Acidobacteriota bacterium]
MPSLKLKPSEGPVGTDVMAIGAGFRPNVSYRTQLEDEWLKPGTTNNRGGFTTIFKIPPAPYGNQDITAISQAAHQLAHATFKVVPEIVLVEPAEVTPGETITLSGTGFGSNEPIVVYLGDSPVNLGTEVRTNPDGAFTVSFVATEDLVPPTPVVIRVIGQETSASAEATQKMELKLAS